MLKEWAKTIVEAIMITGSLTLGVLMLVAAILYFANESILGAITCTIGFMITMISMCILIAKDENNENDKEETEE